jgi:glycosyltransferase involved in cell wall biosynthesis
LRVAYVTIGKADDIHEWSGLNASIRASLLAQGCTVHNVDELGGQYPLSIRAKRRLYSSLSGRTYAPERSPVVAAHWAQIAATKIAGIPSVDAIVSTGTLPVAFLGSETPRIIWADATFHSLRSTYPEYANYCCASIAEGDLVEKRALDNAAMICYASRWAADDAVTYYGIPRRKVRVIPFGANCDSPFSSEVAAVAHVNDRDLSTVRFTFIGVDWKRKGGELAVAIVRRLNRMGIKSQLSIVGCRPPLADEDLPYIDCVGFLSKKTDRDAGRLREVLLQSHFLLLPTSAECFGVVFAEACAFALPCVSRAVGGVPTAVRSTHTGVLLPVAHAAGAYCDALLTLIRDRQRYCAMSVEAYRDYASRLNWQVAGAHFTAELRALLRGTRLTERSAS